MVARKDRVREGERRAKQHEEAQHQEMQRTQHEDIIQAMHHTQQQIGMQMKLSEQFIQQQLQHQQQQQQHQQELSFLQQQMISLMQQQQQQTKVLVNLLDKSLRHCIGHLQT